MNKDIYLNLRDFLLEIIEDTELKKKLKKIDKIEELYNFFCDEYGYTKSLEIFKQDLENILKFYMKFDNISEEDLNYVVGGKGSAKMSSKAMALALGTLLSSSSTMDMTTAYGAKIAPYCSYSNYNHRNSSNSKSNIIKAVLISMGTTALGMTLLYSLPALIGYFFDTADICKDDAKKIDNLYRFLNIIYSLENNNENKKKKNINENLNQELQREEVEVVYNALYECGLQVETSDETFKKYVKKFDNALNPQNNAKITKFHLYKLALLSIRASGFLDIKDNKTNEYIISASDRSDLNKILDNIDDIKNKNEFLKALEKVFKIISKKSEPSELDKSKKQALSFMASAMDVRRSLDEFKNDYINEVETGLFRIQRWVTTILNDKNKAYNKMSFSQLMKGWKELLVKLKSLREKINKLDKFGPKYTVNFNTSDMNTLTKEEYIKRLDIAIERSRWYYSYDYGDNIHCIEMQKDLNELFIPFVADVEVEPRSQD